MKATRGFHVANATFDSEEFSDRNPSSVSDRLQPFSVYDEHYVEDEVAQGE